MGDSIKCLSVCLAAVVACGTDDCPAGTVDMDGRCIEATDTGMNDGGPDTGDTDAGADAPMACGGACMGGTPHCDTDTDTCVACLDDEHCDEMAPVCGAGGVCGPCTGPADCAAYPDTPVCGDSGAVDGTCVGCAGDSDCTDADAGKCDTSTNTCVPCDDSDQCTELPRIHISEPTRQAERSYAVFCLKKKKKNKKKNRAGRSQQTKRRKGKLRKQRAET